MYTCNTLQSSTGKPEDNQRHPDNHPLRVIIAHLSHKQQVRRVGENDLKNIKSKINRCERRINDGQKTKDCMAAEERTSSLEQMALSQVHFSVFQKTKPPQVERCTVCCTHFHCPLCPTGMYKPRSKAMVLQHLEVHKKNALQHEDFYITKCHHACRPGNSGHFHCPLCSRTMVKRQDAERHLSICRLTSVLGEERLLEKKRRSDPIPARQEKSSTGDSPVPELPLPSEPSLDNPSCKVIRASQKSVLCHHCNVKILKKNMNKHIFRKHMNIAGRKINAGSSVHPHPGFGS
ncbi:uncharacterized protein LOC106522588 isoform X2 [Austrofundulus limnaeus]|uniref:Uncharacterized protein LOC106522588 isoform X2 n=1 Tax=Austrofundulus limnaeus TaxID=52670 RepID=A0A2I4BTM9_AUSLI|nr:PREDICTED: uncharacterized protein LOC106522588 isoform X2 [Austrofundulus limnaeus]